MRFRVETKSTKAHKIIRASKFVAVSSYTTHTQPHVQVFAYMHMYACVHVYVNADECSLNVSNFVRLYLLTAAVAACFTATRTHYVACVEDTQTYAQISIHAMFAKTVLYVLYE